MPRIMRQAIHAVGNTAPWGRGVALSAVPIANPGGWAAGKGPANLSGGPVMPESHAFALTG